MDLWESFNGPVGTQARDQSGSCSVVRSQAGNSSGLSRRSTLGQTGCRS